MKTFTKIFWIVGLIGILTLVLVTSQALGQFNFGQCQEVAMGQSIPPGWIPISRSTFRRELNLTYIGNPQFNAEVTVLTEYKHLVPPGWFVIYESPSRGEIEIKNLNGAPSGTEEVVLSKFHKGRLPQYWTVINESTYRGQLTIKYMGQVPYSSQLQAQASPPQPLAYQEPLQAPANPPQPMYQDPLQKLLPSPGVNWCRYAGKWYAPSDNICMPGDNIWLGIGIGIQKECSIEQPGQWGIVKIKDFIVSCSDQVFVSTISEDPATSPAKNACYDTSTGLWYSQGSVICKNENLNVCSSTYPTRFTPLKIDSVLIGCP